MDYKMRVKNDSTQESQEFSKRRMNEHRRFIGHFYYLNVFWPEYRWPSVRFVHIHTHIHARTHAHASLYDHFQDEDRRVNREREEILESGISTFRHSLGRHSSPLILLIRDKRPLQSRDKIVLFFRRRSTRET